MNDLEGFPPDGGEITISRELAERILDFYSRRGIDTGLTAEMLTLARRKIEVEEMLTGLPLTEPSRAYYDITGRKGDPSGDFIPDGPVCWFVDIEDSAGDGPGN